jgi:UDP-N-acetylmuramoyl-L-alanyl-D-glutamate--2,6-diaminopimelate ligase
MEKDLNKFIKSVPVTRDNITTDSKKVRPGSVFVAIRGTSCDGNQYVKEALAKGAAGVICDRKIEGLSEAEAKKVLLVPDTREALALAAKNVFEDPSSALDTYGITGTNGKTTTVFLVDSILNAAGRKSGFLSTVFNKTGGSDMKRSSMTTADIISLNRMLFEMVTGGRRAAVVEISSHALDQERIGGITLNSAVFTNITPEHLDYHKDMDDYLRAKAKIFTKLKPGGIGALNEDDPMVIGLKGKIDVPRLVTFGFGKTATVRAEGIRLLPDRTEFDLIAEGLGKIRIDTPLIGRHNIYNIMGAVSALLSSGIDLAEMKRGVEKVRNVPGRLDAVISKAPFGVYVDYAHTPNALENVLKSLRPLTSKRLICVFGCGGDRDRTKRPVMGRIAADICDKVIITSDNPRTERPEAIIKEIQKGVPDKNNYSIIEDRQEAIRKALETAESGDIVIIAGKGHEDYQVIGDKVTHFDDKEVAANALNDLGY